jgi:two-component sensor histidine kinase
LVPHPLPEVWRSLALALIEASTTPVLLLDKELNVAAASASFCDAFQIVPSEMDSRPFAELSEGEWNVPQLIGLLKATASGFAAVKNYELNLARNGQSDRCFVVNAKKLDYAGDMRLLLSIADVTDARIAEKLREDLIREKEVLLLELNHRVANSLQIVASVLMQGARQVNSEETRSHLHDAHHRVMSVATMHKHLASSKQGDVELRPYLSGLCDSIDASMIHDRDRLSLEVIADEGIATANTSVSLGLIVTELVINAIKHAFPENRGGRILVNYHSRGSDWTLSVKDDGVGMAENRNNSKAGLGTSIVEAIAKQLGAKIEVADAHPGTKVSIAHTSVPVLVAKTAV